MVDVVSELLSFERNAAGVITSNEGEANCKTVLRSATLTITIRAPWYHHVRCASRLLVLRNKSCRLVRNAVLLP
jgi:hypothetical protein